MNSKPVWIWFDPTTNCNLKCEYCYTKSGHGSDRVRPSTFEKYLSRIFSSDNVSVKGVHLNWKGEPLMNPEFSKLITATQNYLPTGSLQWHTNGTMLTQKRVEEIVSANVDQLIYVSIDGGNKKSHDFNRGAGTFDDALRGLERLISERDSKGAHNIRIGLYQIDFGIAKDAYDKKFIELCAKVDIYTSVDAVIDKGEISVDKETTKENDASIIATCKSNSSQPSSSCFWAGNAFFVAPNGDVSVCILSNSRNGILGNLLLDDFSVIVERAELFRGEIDKLGRASLEHCRQCYKPEGKVFEEHLGFS